MKYRHDSIVNVYNIITVFVCVVLVQPTSKVKLDGNEELSETPRHNERKIGESFSNSRKVQTGIANIIE